MTKCIVDITGPDAGGALIRAGLFPTGMLALRISDEGPVLPMSRNMTPTHGLTGQLSIIKSTRAGSKFNAIIAIGGCGYCE
jgi:hypothetical protein